MRTPSSQNSNYHNLDFPSLAPDNYESVTLIEIFYRFIIQLPASFRKRISKLCLIPPVVMHKYLRKKRSALRVGRLIGEVK